MIKVKDIFQFIDKIAPFEKSMKFDNCGLLIGDINNEVKKVLVALDVTKDVIKEASEIGTDLIISHHPIIFHPLKKIKFGSIPDLICKNNINIICAHTNLDIAEKGVNFHLAKLIGLKNLEPLAYEEDLPIGLVGNLDNELTDKEFALHVKKSLGCGGIRYTKSAKKIKKAAVCSGSGGEFYENAYLKGADVIVTGEIKHSQILSANELPIMIVDAGHFKTENVIIEPLKNELISNFPKIEIFSSEICTDNINYA